MIYFDLYLLLTFSLLMHRCRHDIEYATFEIIRADDLRINARKAPVLRARRFEPCAKINEEMPCLRASAFQAKARHRGVVSAHFLYARCTSCRRHCRYLMLSEPRRAGYGRRRQSYYYARRCTSFAPGRHECRALRLIYAMIDCFHLIKEHIFIIQQI